MIFVLHKGDMNESQYEQVLKENQSNIREMVLESVKDIKAGKGRDYKDHAIFRLCC